MPLAPIFELCFAPLIGRPCWQVTLGHASCITLEFGEPHLEIRQPVEALPDVSQKVRAMMARRSVTVRGEWFLWIYGCNWTVFKGDELVGSADEEDSHNAGAATKYLDGQILTAYAVDSASSCRFTFDLGGSLTTSPFDDDSEQWMLYEPDGNVLSLRANGTYCHSQLHFDSESEEWRPAWIS